VKLKARAGSFLRGDDARRGPAKGPAKPAAKSPATGGAGGEPGGINLLGQHVSTDALVIAGAGLAGIFLFIHNANKAAAQSPTIIESSGGSGGGGTDGGSSGLTTGGAGGTHQGPPGTTPPPPPPTTPPGAPPPVTPVSPPLDRLKLDAYSSVYLPASTDLAKDFPGGVELGPYSHLFLGAPPTPTAPPGGFAGFGSHDNDRHPDDHRGDSEHGGGWGGFRGFPPVPVLTTPPGAMGPPTGAPPGGEHRPPTSPPVAGGHPGGFLGPPVHPPTGLPRPPAATDHGFRRGAAHLPGAR
jgi:hypothetical protein